MRSLQRLECEYLVFLSFLFESRFWVFLAVAVLLEQAMQSLIASVRWQSCLSYGFQTLLCHSLFHCQTYSDITIPSVLSGKLGTSCLFRNEPRDLFLLIVVKFPLNL